MSVPEREMGGAGKGLIEQDCEYECYFTGDELVKSVFEGENEETEEGER